MAVIGPQNGRRGLVCWHSRQLPLNKFLDPSTPSTRKVDDREKRKEKNGVFSGHYVIASSLLPEQRRLNDDARTTTAGTAHARANR